MADEHCKECYDCKSASPCSYVTGKKKGMADVVAGIYSLETKAPLSDLWSNLLWPMRSHYH
jgi:hypothetical protein